MNYYNSVISSNSFEECKAKIVESLKQEGFGILTEIDIQATMKNKLDKDYLPHLILGACNPVFADRALQTDMNISVMLPCNVTLKQLADGKTEISSINPEAAIGALGNEKLSALAAEVQAKLVRALNRD
jgi:uncharacterized protein (DUF302 family)